MSQEENHNHHRHNKFGLTRGMRMFILVVSLISLFMFGLVIWEYTHSLEYKFKHNCGETSTGTEFREFHCPEGTYFIKASELNK